MTPGEKLRIEIDRKGYKHSRFAEMTGIAPNTLSRILTGDRNLTKRYAERAAAVLNIEPGYLLYSDETVPYDTRMPEVDVEVQEAVKLIERNKEFLTANQIKKILHAING